MLFWNTIFLFASAAVYGMTQAQKYNVSLTPSEAILNEGDNLRAQCNIPGLSLYEILSTFVLRWYHNGRNLANWCEFNDPETITDKYGCNLLLPPQQKNLSFEFTIKNIQKMDSVNLTCEVSKRVKDKGKSISELVAKKAVVIKVRDVTQAQKYNVSLTPSEAILNEGDNFRALCNIPGLSALEIVRMLKVRWYHNGRHLTSLCEFEDPDTMSYKYGCNWLSPQQKNTSLELTIKNIQKMDSGNLTCEVSKRVKDTGEWISELVAKKAVVIKVRACDPGTYGKDCKEVCGHCEGNVPCNHINGSCPGLCEPGYQGQKCLTKCESMRYGEDCSSTCGHCATNATCDEINGACPDGNCAPGWTDIGDRKCDRACNDGWYGAECKERCGYCRNNKPCNRVTGSCSGFCEPGYHGEKCEESEFSQLLAIQRKMLNSVRELLSFKRRKVELIANGTSPTDLK